MFTKYDREDSIQSVYCYSGTDIYKNKFKIMDSKRLSEVESDLVSNRLIEMSRNPIRGRFGVAHFLKIHKYMFQDVYYFAGKTREEDIWKGNTFFCKCEYIKSSLSEVLLKLKSEKYLKECNDKDIVSRLAFYMSELNMIHPFREGNGRAIREFIRILAHKNNYIINWQYVDSEMLFSATIMAADCQYDLLEECIMIALGINVSNNK
ncbi:MAG: Fic family protein [Bacillota bacterium]|nr:Fic family protein [Bacillota bacterium]